MTLSSKVVLLGMVVAALVPGCDNNPVDGKATARVGQAVQTSTQPSAAATRWDFSEGNSQLGFVGAKITGKHEGNFGKFSGQIRLDENDITHSSVEVQVDIASLSTGIDRLDAHLKSPDFFDIARFPKATFKSTSIVPTNSNGATHLVTGNLELHGVTHSITFPAHISVPPAAAEIKAEFGINRKDFGIVYPGKPDDLIKDEVLIRVTLKPQKAPN